MSKTVFDVLQEKIDQVILGRRYIIAEIGKVKVSVEDFRDALDKAQFSEVATAITDMKAFMQRAVGTLGELKSSVTNLSNTVASLNGSVQRVFNTVSGMKGLPSGGGAPAPTPSPSPAFSPTPAPAPAPSPAPAPAPSAPAGGGGDRFKPILDKARAQTAAKDLGIELDTLRTQLSKENPLNPILFELSMEAGRLKSMGAKPLSGADIGTLENKINNWRAKSK